LAAIVAGLPPPLSPIQLLWINLVTDVLPALAIGFEEPEWDVLKQPPVDAAQGVLSGTRLLDLLRQSLPITGATVIAYLYALKRYGPGPRARTQAFMTLTQAQLLQALSSRARNSSVFSRRRTPANRWLRLSLGASVVAQLGTTLPGIGRVLGVRRLGFFDLLVVAAGSTIPLLINEWVKERRLPPLQEQSDEG
jgi:Ca2+-transporting ATPase